MSVAKRARRTALALVPRRPPAMMMILSTSSLPLGPTSSLPMMMILTTSSLPPPRCRAVATPPGSEGAGGAAAPLLLRLRAPPPPDAVPAVIPPALSCGHVLCPSPSPLAFLPRPEPRTTALPVTPSCAASRATIVHGRSSATTKASSAPRLSAPLPRPCMNNWSRMARTPPGCAGGAGTDASSGTTSTRGQVAAWSPTSSLTRRPSPTLTRGSTSS